MGKFEDVLADATELPEEVKSILTNAYQEDLSIPDAKVADLTTELSARDTTIAEMTENHKKEVSSLKSANYDLLKAVPKDAEEDQDKSETEHPDGHNISIADLFGNKS